jgi:hypothetical protein
LEFDYCYLEFGWGSEEWGLDGAVEGSISLPYELTLILSEQASSKFDISLAEKVCFSHWTCVNISPAEFINYLRR